MHRPAPKKTCHEKKASEPPDGPATLQARLVVCNPRRTLDMHFRRGSPAAHTLVQTCGCSWNCSCSSLRPLPHERSGSEPPTALHSSAKTMKGRGGRRTASTTQMGDTTTTRRRTRCCKMESARARSSRHVQRRPSRRRIWRFASILAHQIHQSRTMSSTTHCVSFAQGPVDCGGDG